jgi:uncharacterized coiled-coil DUF342 family protein
VGGQLTDLSTIADEYHKKVVETYGEIKKKNEEASEAHKRLTERYGESDPIRSQIGAIKDEIGKIREELAPVNDALEDIRLKREENRRLELAREAREKLKTSKRVSLNDLRIILEQGGLEQKEHLP